MAQRGDGGRRARPHAAQGQFLRPRPEEERFITAAFIGALTTTGTADELVERVRGRAASGYEQRASCLAPGREDASEAWALGRAGV